MKRKGIVFVSVITFFFMCGVVFSCKTGDNKAVADCEITAPFDSLFSTIFTDPVLPAVL